MKLTILVYSLCVFTVHTWNTHKEILLRQHGDDYYFLLPDTSKDESCNGILSLKDSGFNL